MRPPKLTVTTKTRTQIRADFKEAFKDVQPDKPAAPVTQEQRLKPYHDEVLLLRKRGLTWKQIAEGMARPPVSEAVSAKVLRRVFGQDDAVQTAAAGDPPSDRLIIDPATGLHIIVDSITGKYLSVSTVSGAGVALAAGGSTAAAPVVAAAPAPLAPMTPKEHEQFDPLFKGLIPPIVQTKANRRDARAYANNAVEQLPPKQVERFHALLTAELDALTETNCARYGLPPEAIAPWKRRWA